MTAADPLASVTRATAAARSGGRREPSPVVMDVLRALSGPETGQQGSTRTPRWVGKVRPAESILRLLRAIHRIPVCCSQPATVAYTPVSRSSEGRRAMERRNKRVARFGDDWLLRGDPTLSELFFRLRETRKGHRLRRVFVLVTGNRL